MALLKKIRSATLVEAIVATALVVIIFIVASVILNNLLLNNFSKNSHAVETRMTELQYLAAYKNIELPYTESMGGWKITLKQEVMVNNKNLYWIKASGNKGSREIKKSILCNAKS